MSGYEGIAAVGKSIERMLGLAFTEREPVKNKHTRAVLAQSEDLAPSVQKQKIGQYALSILLYRVDFNKAMRAAWSSVGTADGRGHLPLDLHFLLTPWADNAEHEQLIIGRAMQAIEFSPVLTGPLLARPEVPETYTDEPRPAPVDAVQMLLEEISTEALMRIFDSLPCDYHLTVPYVARVARIDTREARLEPPVVDARFELRVPA